MTINRARKRTGVILADSLFEEVIEKSKQAGFFVIEALAKQDYKLLLTDDQLIERIKLLAVNSPCLILNLEMYVAPRLSEPDFMKQFAQKLVVLEPKQPIVFLLYSARVFSSLNAVYSQTLPHAQHTLNLIEN